MMLWSYDPENQHFFKMKSSHSCQKPNVNVAKPHTGPALKPAHEANGVAIKISVGTRSNNESGNNPMLIPFPIGYDSAFSS
jgi:hypothetical protein